MNVCVLRKAHRDPKMKGTPSLGHDCSPADSGLPCGPWGWKGMWVCFPPDRKPGLAPCSSDPEQSGASWCIGTSGQGWREVGTLSIPRSPPTLTQNPWVFLTLAVTLEYLPFWPQCRSENRCLQMTHPGGSQVKVTGLLEDPSQLTCSFLPSEWFGAIRPAVP